MIYADSSFLVSLYLKDANSEVARWEVKNHPQEIALSRIAGLEVRNAFRLAVFASFDGRQRKLAEKVGLRLAPTQVDK